MPLDELALGLPYVRGNGPFPHLALPLRYATLMENLPFCLPVEMPILLETGKEVQTRMRSLYIRLFTVLVSVVALLLAGGAAFRPFRA
jgi:hypothetical protein